MTKYVTFKSICSVCGCVYASREVSVVFKDNNDPRLRAIRRDGYVQSHGYCPICKKEAQQELRMVARKAINLHA